MEVWLRDLVGKEGVFRLAFFENGKEVADLAYKAKPLTNEAIQGVARSEVARLVAAEIPSTVTIKVGEQIDLTPPASSLPSAEEKARAEYYAARGIYTRMLEDIRLGERKADDADVLAAQQNMAALRRPEYL